MSLTIGFKEEIYKPLIKIWGSMAWRLRAQVLQQDGLSSYFTSVTLLCDFVPMSGILMQVCRVSYYSC